MCTLWSSASIAVHTAPHVSAAHFRRRRLPHQQGGCRSVYLYYCSDQQLPCVAWHLVTGVTAAYTDVRAERETYQVPGSIRSNLNIRMLPCPLQTGWPARRPWTWMRCRCRRSAACEICGACHNIHTSNTATISCRHSATAAAWECSGNQRLPALHRTCEPTLRGARWTLAASTRTITPCRWGFSTADYHN